MKHDFKSYQSADTAWRYESQIKLIKNDIEKAETKLAELKLRLKKLEDNPPLYDTFNWSA
jgi:hypothetical protein